MLEKIDVNGSKAHPVYEYLRKHAPELNGGSVPHNFGKFIVYEKGGKEIINFHKPATQPLALLPEIEPLLS